MAKQLIFIDDSGDPGLKDGANSSNLVMAAAVFIDPEEAGRMGDEISALRKSLGWKEEHEFKFRKASKEVKIRFLKMANRFDFEIYAVYIDKSQCTIGFRLSNHEQLYNWTIKELLKIIPMDEAVIKIDGSMSRKYKLKTKSNIRKEVNSTAHKISDIKSQDSAKDNLIQLADMIVGSINRSFQPEKSDARIYFGIIKRKIKGLRMLEIK